MRLRNFLFLLAVIFLFTAEPNTAHASHPCREIAKQCRKEGYSIGGVNSSGQGLVKDCMEKIVAGQTLPGISVNFKTLGECKVRFDRRVASGQKPSRRLTSDDGEDFVSRPQRSRESTGFTEYTGGAAPAASSSSSGTH